MDQRGNDTVDVTRKTLELRQYAMASKVIGKTGADSLIYSSDEDPLTREVIHRIGLSVLSDKLADDEYKARYQYYVYGSWWEHFKHDHMPAWFVKRYPVKKIRKSGYVTVKFTRYAEYPKANVELRGTRTFDYMLGGFERIIDNVEQIR